MRRFWTESELEWIRKRYHEVPARIIAATLDRPVGSVYQKAAELGLKAPTEKIARMSAERMASKVEHGGRATQFAKGLVPWNKGRKGVSYEGMQATQFKPGRLACEARNYVPIGSHRLSKDGYLERKVTDDPALAPARRWVGVHRLVWEQANGPVPAGHAVVFKAGRRTTDPELITPDAVECITRRELMLRNTVHRYGPEIARVVQLRGAINRQINKRAKKEQGNGK